jgi:catechol 2,3-dioxygenase-like lactoylglutathione lyase family enzyme
MTAPAVDSIPNQTPPGATDVVKFHVSLNVADLPRSLAFYSALFGIAPAKAYTDYAKFELDEPPLVISLKPHPAKRGGPLNHLGLRLKTTEDLLTVGRRLTEAGYRVSRQDDVRCCYAHQTKFWVADPDETLWEVYVLHADFPRWGAGNKLALMMPSLRALGFFGSLRRALSKPFRLFGRRPAEKAAPEIHLPPGEEGTAGPTAPSCQTRGPALHEPR